MASKLPLSTIGYEAAPLGEVLGRLCDAGVELLIDVRAVALSRRAGFSKTLLSASLGDVGIDYLHLRALGTPKDGRMAAKAGQTAVMRKIFQDHMRTDGAMAALEQAISVCGERRACLLCFEKDWACCHRAIVADMIAARVETPIIHL